jgi:hypothetical protein
VREPPRPLCVQRRQDSPGVNRGFSGRFSFDWLAVRSAHDGLSAFVVCGPDTSAGAVECNEKEAAVVLVRRRSQPGWTPFCIRAFVDSSIRSFIRSFVDSFLDSFVHGRPLYPTTFQWRPVDKDESRMEKRADPVTP